MCINIGLNPLYLSNNFIARSLNNNIEISPMKLQKMLYYTYRDYLKETGNSLFSNRFATWKYGPVLEDVYHEFKHYRGNPILNYDVEWDDAFNKRKAYKVNENTVDKLEDTLNTIWQTTKYKSAQELSTLTHSTDGAWFQAFKAGAPFLSDEDIKKDTTVI